jgi:tight adherence protein B
VSPLVGVVAVFFGVLIATYGVLAPGDVRVARSRLRPDAPAGPSLLTRSTEATTTLIDRIMRSRGRGQTAAGLLERAGLTIRVQDLALLVGGGALAAGALGLLLSGLLVGMVAGALVLLGARLYVGFLASRRRAAFADQLDDSLQLLASSLRAGHSLLQALNSVSKEAEEPTAGEFSRIINETRVGRPLIRALDETADRMGSEDFVWVSQAIAINREVGGNLAEVLDGVGHTIRERNQIRRQVKALSAEGKLSAYVLLALPVGISGFLSMSNPEYMSKFTQSPLGYTLIGVALVMMTIGALWLRKIVSFSF